MKILAMLMISLGFTSALNAQAPSQSAPSQEELEKTIAALDKTLFDAYNTCDLAKFKSLLADDIEFYHDKGGVTLGKDNLTEAIKNNICGKVTRELIGRLEVYPMKGIGAIEIGVHRFHHPGQEPDSIGEAKFIQLWIYKDGAWKISRVLSFDHHEAK
jgi:ketosteroid isomerase-like protein